MEINYLYIRYMNNIPIHKNTELLDLKDEEWIDVVGYDGSYNVSNMGRIKSVGRFVNSSNGRQKWVKERILKQHVSKRNGQVSVKLSVDNIKKTHNVMILVGDAFLRRKQDGEEYCHKNKILTDNRLSNIIITDHSHSQKISYKHGNLKNWGIEQFPKQRRKEYLKENGVYDNDNQLIKKKCAKCRSLCDVSEYYKGNVCKKCTLENLGVKEIGKLTDRIQLAKNGLRYCSICKVLKSLNKDFGNYKNGFIGKTSTCKSCVKILNAKYRNRRK